MSATVVEQLLTAGDTAYDVSDTLTLDGAALSLSGCTVVLRLEHRWTYAVFVAALLHDVGKPVTDVLVTLYTNDPRDGRAKRVSITPKGAAMRELCIAALDPILAELDTLIDRQDLEALLPRLERLRKTLDEQRS